MQPEVVLAFSIGTFAIFVGAVVLIVRFMVNRLTTQHDKELQRAYTRGYTAGWNDCMEESMK
jgi:hypothetical protein